MSLHQVDYSVIVLTRTIEPQERRG